MASRLTCSLRPALLPALAQQRCWPQEHCPGKLLLAKLGLRVSFRAPELGQPSPVLSPSLHYLLSGRKVGDQSQRAAANLGTLIYEPCPEYSSRALAMCPKNGAGGALGRECCGRQEPDFCVSSAPCGVLGNTEKAESSLTCRHLGLFIDLDGLVPWEQVSPRPCL